MAPINFCKAVRVVKWITSRISIPTARVLTTAQANPHNNYNDHLSVVLQTRLPRRAVMKKKGTFLLQGKRPNPRVSNSRKRTKRTLLSQQILKLIENIAQSNT